MANSRRGSTSGVPATLASRAAASYTSRPTTIRGACEADAEPRRKRTRSRARSSSNANGLTR